MNTSADEFLQEDFTKIDSLNFSPIFNPNEYYENDNCEGKFLSKELDNILKTKTNYIGKKQNNINDKFKGDPNEICFKYNRAQKAKNIDDSGRHYLNENSEIKNNINLNNLPSDNSLNSVIINNNVFNSNSNQNINNSGSNNSAHDYNHNSNQNNNISKVNNSSQNNNIRFKTEAYENPKARKFSNDLQIKKLKGKFFRYIREILDPILIKNNKEDKFDYFPKILKEGLEKDKFKNILNLKLIDFINFEVMEKITYKNNTKNIELSENNKRLFEFLKDKQDEKFKKTLKDLYDEYLNSEQYKTDIDGLKSKYDNEYMDSYKKIVANFIKQYFGDNEI